MVFNQLHKRFRLRDFVKYSRQFKAQRKANVNNLARAFPIPLNTFGIINKKKDGNKTEK